MPRRLPGYLVLAVVAAAIGLFLWSSSPSTPSPPSAVASTATNTAVNAAVHGCPNRAAAARASKAFKAAEARYLLEERGHVVHVDLNQIAHDNVLLGALAAGKLHAALAEANRQLIRHVVQIRVLRGARVLLDANPTSFDVAGPATELHATNGRSLGRLEITLQDVIGFIKLIHKINAADVVVRDAVGHMETSFPAAAKLSLPRSGCTRIGSRSYVVRSFDRTSFTHVPLTIWVLTPA